MAARAIFCNCARCDTARLLAGIELLGVPRAGNRAADCKPPGWIAGVFFRDAGRDSRAPATATLALAGTLACRKMVGFLLFRARLGGLPGERVDLSQALVRARFLRPRRGGLLVKAKSIRILFGAQAGLSEVGGGGMEHGCDFGAVGLQCPGMEQGRMRLRQP